MNEQAFWVQAIGNVASAPNVTQNDLAGAMITFTLGDGRRVEVIAWLTKMAQRGGE